jgi:hypothetical protein
MNNETPFALSLSSRSRPEANGRLRKQCFDKLSTNGSYS